jgi:hypothetical protein
VREAGFHENADVSVYVSRGKAPEKRLIFFAPYVTINKGYYTAGWAAAEKPSDAPHKNTFKTQKREKRKHV